MPSSDAARFPDPTPRGEFSFASGLAEPETIRVVDRTLRWANALSFAPRDVSGERMRAAIRRRDEILGGVSQAASRLFDVTPWRERISEVLAILGGATGTSRVYVFEVVRHERDGNAIFSQRFEWVAEGVAPQIENPDLREVPAREAGFGRWAELLGAGNPVYGDVHEFPESEQPLLAAQGIQSLLVEPIFAGPTWWGFIGFDACDEAKSWDSVEVDALRIIAMLLGSSIERESREIQLRQAQKMEALGRMAGGIAHDFNNALMVMFGGLDLVRRGLEKRIDPETIARHLDMIEQAAQQARGVTRRLLDFSRRRESKPTVFSPLDSLRAMQDLLRQALGETVRLEIDGSGDPTMVRMDPVQFEQVVLNLAMNSRDAMPKGGRFAVRVEPIDQRDALAGTDQIPGGQWIRLRVADDGEGMTPEVAERVFEPFFTTKGPSRGTGLGLATVYSIVQSSGGRIHLTTAPGKGAEFRIYLPLVHAEPVPDRPATPIVLEGGGRRALVCEDNDSIRMWVADALAECGFEVRSASSGDAAWKLVRDDQFVPDLVVTDVVMPGLTGPALVRKVVGVAPSVSVVFMSGYAADMLEREGIDRSKVTLLDKPFGADRLIAAVKQELDHAASPGERRRR